MRRLRAGLMLALAACGGDDGGIYDPPCAVDITFTPPMPIAGPTTEVRATSFVDSDVYGVRTYSWTVRRNGASVTFEDARIDGSEIKFIADEPGVYQVTADVDVPGYQCTAANESVTARASDEGNLVRLHITPPLGVDAPVNDRIIEVPDSPDYDLGSVVLDPGTSLDGTVQGSGSGVPAYLRFTPVGVPDAAVEAFADGGGVFAARLANVTHEVLIVPGGGFAPTTRMWSPGNAGAFAVTTGMAVTGVVRNPAGAALAGAKVQFTVDGVPSTLATTAADGSYTVQVAGPGVDVQVEVVPPAATGLPRLEAFGALDLTSDVDIAYASSLVVRDLSGMQLRRSSPLANAKLTVVGSLSSVGTVGTLTATGTVRVAATANGSGALPSTLVAAGPLQGVIAAAPTDLTVVALDLSTSVPTSVTAPAMASISTTITDGVVGLDRAQVQLVPRGALARAGAPSLYLTAGGTGAVSGLVASGGTYDVLITDPVGRAASRFERDVTPTTLASTYALPEPVYVSGVVSVTGNPNRLVGASVQILCTVCDGVDRARPLAEGATDQSGAFTLAVKKPGPL